MSEEVTVQSQNQKTVKQFSEIERIRDALIGATFQYPDADYFLYVFTDYILLYYQQPCFLAIWSEKDHQIIFASLAECDKVRFNIKPIETWLEWATHSGDKYSVEIAKLKTKQIFLAVMPMDSNQSLRRQGALPELVNNDKIFYALEKSIKFAMSDGYEIQKPQKPGHLNDNWQQLLAPLQNRLQNCIGKISESSFFKGEPNLWCVVKHYNISPEGRNVDGHSFGYTASILPTPAQSTSMRKAWEDTFREKTFLPERDLVQNYINSSSDIESFIQTPIGPNSRVIADSVFNSGCMDFGLPDERESRKSRDFANDIQDKARGQLERIVYSSAHDAYKKKTYNVFYVPVHVAGTPWLALYSFWDGESWGGESWDKCYLLYRDVIPAIAGRLRSAAQEAYIDIVSEILGKALQDHSLSSALSMIKGNLDEVACVYPFKVLSLKNVSPHEAVNEWQYWTEEGHTWELQFEKNPYFPRHFERFDLDEDMAGRIFHHVLTSTYASKLAGKIEGMFASAHAGFNTVRNFDAGGIGSYYGDSEYPSRLRFALSRVDENGDVVGKRDIKAEKALLRDIQRVYETETFTAASLAMGQLLAYAGPLKGKFQTESTYSLRALIALTIRFINSSRRKPSVLIEFVNDGYDVTLPVGYFDEHIFVSILYELLNNVRQHSKPSHGGETKAWIVIDEISGTPALSISSIVSSNSENWKMYNGLAVPEKKVSKLGEFKRCFLYRLQSVQERLGVVLTSDITKDETDVMCYNVRLKFGPLAAESQISSVCPVLVNLPSKA